MQLVVDAEKCAKAPEGRSAEKDKEREARQPAGCRSFAPELEHSDESNNEDQNGGNHKSFQPHRTHG